MRNRLKVKHMKKLYLFLLLMTPLLWCLSCEKNKVNPQITISEKRLYFYGNERTIEIGGVIATLPGMRIRVYANFDWNAWADDDWLAIDVPNQPKWGFSAPRIYTVEPNRSNGTRQTKLHFGGDGYEYPPITVGQLPTPFVNLTLPGEAPFEDGE